MFGQGKLYVALTRTRTLRNLKVSGMVATRSALRAVLHSNWRALNWVHGRGVTLPESCIGYLVRMKRMYDLAFS